MASVTVDWISWCSHEGRSSILPARIARDVVKGGQRPAPGITYNIFKRAIKNNIEILTGIVCSACNPGLNKINQYSSNIKSVGLHRARDTRYYRTNVSPHSQFLGRANEKLSTIKAANAVFTNIPFLERWVSFKRGHSMAIFIPYNATYVSAARTARNRR